MLNATFVKLNVFVSQTNGSESLSSVVVYHVVQISFHFISHFLHLTLNIKVVGTTVFYDF
jgi:hypothetical protein